MLELGSDAVVPLNLMRYSGEEYTAMQFDIRVPDGVFINDIVPSGALASHNFSYEMLDMNTYRVVVYSDDNATISGSDDVLVSLDANATSVLEEDARAFEIVNAYAVDGNNDEVRFNDLKIAFSQATDISGVYATYSVNGGDCITVTSLEPQEIVVYSVDGRLVRKVRVNSGTTRIALPAGVYVVNGGKVMVY